MEDIVEIDYINGIKIKLDKRSARFHEWCGSFNKNGEFATEEVMQIYDQLKDIENPVMIDIGANTGSHSMLGLVISNLICYSFEPVPLFYEILKNNLKLNNLCDKVFVSNFALSDKIGFINLSIQNGTSHVDPNGELQVACITLDSIHFDKVDYIKIDTDGHDQFVLEGARETLKKFRPKVLYEGQDDGGTCSRIIQEIYKEKEVMI